MSSLTLVAVAGLAGSCGKPVPFGSHSDGASPDASKILATGVRLVGETLAPGDNQSCTRFDGPGDRWCGFVRPGNRAPSELWVVNVSEIARGKDVKCDGTDAACFMISANALGEYSGFQSDILVVMDGNLSPDGAGTLRAWRPGWSKTRPLTGSSGRGCKVMGQTGVILCRESADLDPSSTGLWRAGTLDLEDGPLLPVLNLQAKSVSLSQGGQYVILDDSYLYSASAGQFDLTKIAGAFRLAPLSDPTNPRLIAALAWYPAVSPDERYAYYLGSDATTGLVSTADLYIVDLPAGSPRKLVAGIAVGEVIPVVTAAGDAGVLAITSPGSLSNEEGTLEWIRNDGRRVVLGDAQMPFNLGDVSSDTAAILADSCKILPSKYLLASKLDGSIQCSVQGGKGKGRGFVPGTDAFVWEDTALFAARLDGKCAARSLGDNIIAWVPVPGEGVVLYNSLDVMWADMRAGALADLQIKTMASYVTQFDYESTARVLLYIQTANRWEPITNPGPLHALVNPF